jgi:hypothetical protein
MTAKSKPTKTGFVPCERCNGRGEWGREIRNGNLVSLGVCFRCRGAKADPRAKSWVFTSEWTEEEREAFIIKEEAKAEARRMKAFEKREAERLAKFPPVVAPVVEPVVEPVKTPAPTGKVEVVATVLGFKGGKVLMESVEGWRLFTSCPDGDWERGDTIRFTVTVEQSDRDAFFAFGKRPSVAEKI